MLTWQVVLTASLVVNAMTIIELTIMRLTARSSRD